MPKADIALDKENYMNKVNNLLEDKSLHEKLNEEPTTYT